MKTATIHTLHEELKQLSKSEVEALCIRLAKFKKDNKELLTYLLFEVQDEEAFIVSIKSEINAALKSINKSNLYFVKKSLRRILRSIYKYCKYANNKQTEAELLLHFCSALQQINIDFSNSTALVNLYQAQIKKIKDAIGSLHEDLQYDFLKKLDRLL